MTKRRIATLYLLMTAFAAGSAPARAQLVPLRTVPVASGDQGIFLPGDALGMGGVHLAVDDTLGDPWLQPARGARLSGDVLLSSLTFYAISDGGGGGRTFPVAALFSGGRWFGGGAVALEQIDNEAGRGDLTLVDPFPGWGRAQERLSDRSLRNLYARVFLGRRLGEGDWSVGFGASVAELDAVDGVDLLYATAERIEQDGSTRDLRVGLFRDGERDRLALLVLHNRVDVVHDVTFVDVRWPPEPPVEGPWEPVVERRVEVNEDRTRTWGAHVAWDRSLEAEGWRVGMSATANRKSHPGIPNYDIQNIPRDPGTTWAWEAGVGVARTLDGTTFGLDLAVQPIWSETWQEADTAVTGTGGRVFREGDRTIENDFFFTNVMLRAGLSHRWERLTARAGVELRSYDYELEQEDPLQGTVRDQEEGWMEWTPSLGLEWRLGELELRYAGRLTTGTGQPGVDFDGRVAAGLEDAADFILAPSGPLTLQDATVTTHQLSVRIPMG